MSPIAPWIRKFENAFRGIKSGIEGQNSFLVHIPCGLIVIGLAAYFRCQAIEWGLLLLCIGTVLTAELFNSALEWLAKGLCHEQNREVGRALDIASGAVLVASIFATLAGLAIVLSRFFS